MALTYQKVDGGAGWQEDITPLGPTHLGHMDDGIKAVSDRVDVIDGAGGPYIPKALVDATGDLIVGTAADTVGRLAVGAGESLLKVAAGTPAWLAKGTDGHWLRTTGGALVWETLTLPKVTVPRCALTMNGAFTIGDSVWTLVTWDSGDEESDPDGWHNPAANPARITLPATGLYLIGFDVTMNSAGTQPTVIGFQMQLNTEVAPGAVGTGRCYLGLGGLAGGIANALSAVAVRQFTANDYLAAVAFSNGTTNTIGDVSSTMFALQLA